MDQYHLWLAFLWIMLAHLSNSEEVNELFLFFAINWSEAELIVFNIDQFEKFLFTLEQFLGRSSSPAAFLVHLIIFLQFPEFKR